jgi:ubiquinone biosynthesis protein
MGPTFVKFGQFLSTRADLIEKAIVLELQKLQDSVKPIPAEAVRSIVESELGRPLDQIFSSFDEECIASASIGQVHRARLKTGDSGGASVDVVVKVQKPGLSESFSHDLAIVRQVNELTSWADRDRAADIRTLLDQYETHLNAELDFSREREHMVEFRKVASQFPAKIRVPKPYASFSTRAVLTMEHVPAIKATNKRLLEERGVDCERLAKSLADIFLHQIVNVGLVHCDPHPGNVGVCVEDPETIVMYDFGNVIRRSQSFRSRLDELVFSIYQQDVDEFVGLMIDLGILSVEDADDKTRIKVFFGTFFQYLQSVDIDALKRTVTQNSSGAPTSRVALKLDPNFTALFRVFSLLDGTCTLLNPKFSYMDCLYPYVVGNVMTDFGFFDNRARKDLSKMQKFSSIVQRNENAIVRMKDKVGGLEARVNAYAGLAGLIWMAAYFL